ncbi:ABC transporter related protein [Xylanimonas cellulosilytica DSM 15894]|uniref:ABC transporter related protein n=1 Tax=Xylanimonas cellulosilytica (strain DSM 15894 / JCM 12276 / CECT 5975 / KCTC 9989 / LMG 20990 / NBRC 107835 / XIL07) TaxID=446471 RepID=D1BXE2_XYLCX|nr:ABC transporter ATP-binding protein [Xylanimonas cellulosilytica]ACZ29752.1 ABC transporter related protein [Xylanimonas cellulosilytica DSM 15894]
MTTITSPTSSSAVEPAETLAVRLSGVGKRFADGPLVLDGVDLEIAPGELVCLIGASGCGKSTLLSILAGLEPASSGSLRFPAAERGGASGDVVAGAAALMFQESALLPWLTAARNVELALKLRGVPRDERRARAAELLHLVRLDGAADKRAHELSGGMRQRVALARALAQDREILLMDEPFAALDAITRDLLHDELERIWRTTQRTVVFVTHNVREAVRLGQRVLLLSSRPGRVVHEWNVGDQDPVRLTGEITARLREEISRHAH